MRIAVLQMTSGIAPLHNADTLTAAIAEASRARATMLFTPEMSGLIDRDRARAALSITSEANDKVLQAVCDAARMHGIWVSLGSLAIMGGDRDQKLSNRSFLIDDRGKIRARYDKIHLFDVDLPTGESWRESNAYASGERAVLAETPAGKLGMTICYDLRFPALYQALSGAGATILSVPAAFTVPTGKAHWHTLLKARAIENACWVVAAAQTGTHEDGRMTYGHSLVIDPWGEIMLDMGDGAGIGFADIHMEKVEEARQRVSVIAHRRRIERIQHFK